MAKPQVIGTPQVITLSAVQNPAAQVIDVPTDAQAVAIAFAGWAGGALGLQLDGSATVCDFATLTVKQTVIDSNRDLGGWAYGLITATGATRSLQPVWNNSPGTGPSMIVVFLKDVDTGAPWYDAPTPLAFDATTGNITLAANDAANQLVLVAEGADSEIPGNPASGWASHQTQLNNSIGLRVRTLNTTATPTNSIDSVSSSYPTLAGLTVKGTSGGSAPVLSSPGGAATGPNSSSGSVSTNTGSGTLYWVTTTSATPPSDATIKAGSSQTVTATGVQNVTSGGLSPSTTYYNHFIQTNGGLDSNVVSSSGFTTPAAGTPPTVSIGSQTVAGQSITVAGTYTGTPTSATCLIPAAAVPNGAVTQGPSAVTYGSGTFTVTFTGLPPGDYDPPEVTMSNGSGSDTDAGLAFTVMEIDGEPEAPNPGNTEESITPVDSQDRSTARIGAGVETVTPGDSQSATPTISRATAESLATADTTNRTASASAAQAETVAPADTQAATPGITRATPETVAPADAQNRTLAATAAQAESAPATDSQNASSVLGNSVQEAVALTDTEGMAAGLVRDTPEAVVSADQQSCTIGKQGATAEAVNPEDVVSGLVVMGATTVEALVALGESANGVVSSIVGVVDEVVVLSEQQFQSLIVAGGVTEFVQVEEHTDSAPIITPLTVVEQVDLRDTTSRLLYPKPPGAGNNQVRRFIVYYK